MGKGNDSQAESGVLGTESTEGLLVEPDGKCKGAVASLTLCSCSRSSIGERVLSSFGSQDTRALS